MRPFLPTAIAALRAVSLVAAGGLAAASGQEDPPPEEEPVREPLEKLVFVEAHFDEQNGVDGLDQVYSIAQSPDGKHLYAAAMADDALAVFERDSETGQLVFLERLKDGEGGIEDLDGARSVAISPDGDHAYAVAMFDNALTMFARDGASGKLTPIGSASDDDPGVDGMAEPRSVAISPDGKHLYVAGWKEDALAVFSRDSGTGAASFQGRYKQGEDGVTGLKGPHHLAFSPDGLSLYVSLWGEDAVSHFRRDADLGLLEYEGKLVNGEGEVRGLRGTRASVVSANGERVYVAAWNDDAVTILDRDSEGRLSYADTRFDGLGDVAGLDAPHALALSADGLFLYAASFFDDAITVFARDRDTGELTYDQSVFDGEGEVVGLNGALTLHASADGEHVYVASTVDRSLVTLRREIVVAPPEFVVQPVSLETPIGEAAAFHALAEGADVTYQWYRDGAAIPGATLPAYRIDGVAAADDGAVFTARASNEGGVVETEAATLTALPEIVLQRPESLTALAISSSEIELAWIDASDNETGFEIQRKVAGGSYETMATVLAGAESHLDAGVDAGTAFIYRARARRGSEASLWSNEAVVESFDSVPNPPAELRVNAISYDRVEIQWRDRSAVEDGFKVQRRDGEGGVWETVGETERSVTIFEDATVQPARVYAYRVFAFNESGASAFSNGVVAITDDFPVDSVSPTSREVGALPSSGHLVSVVAGADKRWHARPSVDWIRVEAPSGGAGQGSEPVTYAVLENRSVETRSGTLVVGGRVHAVKQAAGEPFVRIEPEATAIGPDGGVVNLQVRANIPWTASAGAPWLEFLGETSGQGDATLVLSVAPNDQFEGRDAEVAANEARHAISQSGVERFTRVSPGSVDFGSEGGELEASVSSNEAWTAVVEGDWLEIVGPASGEGDGTLTLRAAPNGTGAAREGRVRIGQATLTARQAAPGAPAAPGEPTIDFSGGRGVWVRWLDRSDDEDGFVIERRFEEATTWIELGRVGPDVTEFFDDSVEPGRSYVYRITAYREGAGASSIEIHTGELPLSRFVNLSTRGWVGRGDRILIAGFVAQGPESLPLLTRGVGPKLEAMGVSGVLGDPRLRARAAKSAPQDPDYASNRDWGEALSPADLRQLETGVGAFGLSESPREAAMREEYPGGAYTLLLSDEDGGEGIALVEVYALEGGANRLVNLSTRGYVGRGDALLIGGFVIEGETPLPLLLRGVGPGLEPLGVKGTLEDPQLELFRNAGGANAAVATNDDWSADPQAAEALEAAFGLAGAFGLASGSADAALLLELEPGVYTCHLRGAPGTASGIGLFEIYVAR